MMWKTPLLLVALVMFIAAPGCRSATDKDDIDLGQLLPNFLAVSWRIMEKQLADFNADPNRAAGPFTHVEACTNGGEMRVEGDVRVETNAASGARTLQVEAVKTPVNCTFPWGNHTFTISGSPSLTLRGSGLIDGGTARSAQITEAGSYTWRVVNGRRNGTCAVDISSNIDPQQRTGTVDGTWCRSVGNWPITWNPLD